MSLYHDLKFSAQEVAELGKWKNQQAFQKHYCRLGVATLAQDRLQKFLVHKAVSLGTLAEADQSWTPRTEDRGGKDWEAEARGHSEPTRTHPNRKRPRSPPVEMKNKKGKQTSQGRTPTTPTQVTTFRFKQPKGGGTTISASPEPEPPCPSRQPPSSPSDKGRENTTQNKTKPAT